jgi:hypothetical protein
MLLQGRSQQFKISGGVLCGSGRPDGGKDTHQEIQTGDIIGNRKNGSFGSYRGEEIGLILFFSSEHKESCKPQAASILELQASSCKLQANFYKSEIFIKSSL